MIFPLELFAKGILNFQHYIANLLFISSVMLLRHPYLHRHTSPPLALTLQRKRALAYSLVLKRLKLMIKLVTSGGKMGVELEE
jgi:hypothetical protein